MICMDLTIHLLRALVYILPAYIANCTPVIVGGGPPLDLGRNFMDGRRIFGDNKTIRGFLGGLLFGTLTGLLLPALFDMLSMGPISQLDAIILAFLLSIGAHVGDLLGSFIKRRLNLKPGAPAPLLDQIGFIVFAIMFAYPFKPILCPTEIVIAIAITLLVHPVSNIIAYVLRLKDRPW